MRTAAHSTATLQPMAMHCPSGASSRAETALGYSDNWQAQGSHQLRKKPAQRAEDDDEIPASFCCPITQVSGALGYVLLKHVLAFLCILRASALSGCELSMWRNKHAGGRLG